MFYRKIFRLNEGIMSSRKSKYKFLTLEEKMIIIHEIKMVTKSKTIIAKKFIQIHSTIERICYDKTNT